MAWACIVTAFAACLVAGLAWVLHEAETLDGLGDIGELSDIDHGDHR